MDKETAVELEKIKAEITANKKEISDLKDEVDSWIGLFKKSLFRTVKWLATLGVIGVMSGWKLPSSLREKLFDWITK